MVIRILSLNVGGHKDLVKNMRSLRPRRQSYVVIGTLSKLCGHMKHVNKQTNKADDANIV